MSSSAATHIAGPTEPDRTGSALRAAVREALDGDLADPHDVAERVLLTLDFNDFRAALAELLPSYVREVIRGQRADEPGAPASPRLSSRRWENVAELHAAGALDALLHRREALGPRQWKFLGDCAPDDIETLAKLRRGLAAANQAKAQRFERLAAAMRKGRAATVRDLPADVLLEIFNA